MTLQIVGERLVYLDIVEGKVLRQIVIKSELWLSSIVRVVHTLHLIEVV